ncbi:MAG: sugar kinase [Hamadaea sp.]|nr:sugar kinase [Hamadaea sp.]
MTRFDVLAVGEAMVLLTPDPPGRLRAAAELRVEVAGAESNVACQLAALGVRAAFASRVGDDPFGAVITDRLTGRDVTCLVETDPARRTAVFFKDPEPQGTQVFYYRDGSAAAAMDAEFFARLPAARVVHLTGITPALSPTCAELVRTVLKQKGEATVTFDVNHRAKLWPVEQAGPVLRDLADAADVVFVGLDEAQRLWGVSTADDVRELLPQAGTVVVKDGAVSAVSFTAAGRAEVPTPVVDVLEPVGAGDAFAAGYLFGLLRDAPEELRLSLGHQVAGAALRSPGDVGDLPPVGDLLRNAYNHLEIS